MWINRWTVAGLIPAKAQANWGNNTHAVTLGVLVAQLCHGFQEWDGNFPEVLSSPQTPHHLQNALQHSQGWKGEVCVGEHEHL